MKATGEPVVANSNSEIQVTLDPVLAIGVYDSAAATTEVSAVNIGVNAPLGADAFYSEDVYVGVATNAAEGYSLTISMNNDTSNALVHSDSRVTRQIAPTGADVSAANMVTDTWGYAVSGGNYNPVPLLGSGTTIKEIDEPTGVAIDTTQVSFGTKVSPTLPAGAYSNRVLFTAVAQGGPAPATGTFSGITTMQEMTSEICAAETTPTSAATIPTFSHDTAASDNTTYVPEALLEDTRDGKEYIVRKLADGNCWMSSNLALDFTTTTTLTPSDSNVSANWTPGVATQTTTGTNWRQQNSEAYYNAVHSYTNGDLWVNDAGTATTTTAPEAGSDDYYTRRLGNYYNWYTATAGTGLYSMTSSSPDATDSICPKGWGLPTNTTATNTNGNQYSYANLLTTTYGIASSAAGSTTMRADPLSFILSGYYLYSGSVSNQGSFGSFWSASAYNNTYARVLYFLTSYVYPSSNFYKASGYSVRCVAL